MKQNYQLVSLISELKKLSNQNKVNLWKRIAVDLEKPTRNRRIINIYKINQYAKENETIIVPGKVLGVGELDKRVKVAAFNFSSEALKKINQSGQALTIPELMQQNPKGKGIRILG
jgi:large subunit ribosomal protein L18e